MTAPRVIRGIGHDSGFDRVAVDIANECQQVSICFDKGRPVAALEKMAGRWDSLLLASCVRRCRGVYEPAKRRVADLRGQMDVIRHPAVRVHSRAIATERSRQEILKHVIVSLAIEDGLPMVTAENDVVEPSGNMDTWGARHPAPFAATYERP